MLLNAFETSPTFTGISISVAGPVEGERRGCEHAMVAAAVKVEPRMVPHFHG